MSASGRAIILGLQGLEVRETERYKPVGSQSLVEVNYSSINPADLKHSKDDSHTTVAGYDFVGKVLEGGPDSEYQPGEVVVGLNYPEARRPMHYGAHQSTAIVDSPYFARVPAGQSLSEIAAMPVAFLTAADGLFNTLGFGFPAAGLDGDDARGHPILIWGGASSVGLATIQLAKEAGFYPIITTASPRSHEALKKLGATAVFDYRDANVVENIIQEFTAHNKPLELVFDTVCVGVNSATDAERDQSSLALSLKCLTASGNKPRVTGTLPLSWLPGYLFVYSVRKAEDSLYGFYQDPKWSARTIKFLPWALENFQAKFCMPNVKVIDEIDDVLAKMRRVADGKASFEKFVIQHPLIA